MKTFSFSEKKYQKYIDLLSVFVGSKFNFTFIFFSYVYGS